METNLERLREAVRKANLIDENRCPSFLPGIVTNVDDPQKLGRLKVELDGFSGFETDWLELFEFKFFGVLPKSFLKKRLIVCSINNNYEDLRAQLGTRNLVFLQGDELPREIEKNLGLQFIRVISNESYLYVCVLRNGRYVFEPICALSHVHSPGDSLFQSQDSGGDFQQPISAEVSGNQIYVTTVKKYLQNSKDFPPMNVG